MDLTSRTFQLLMIIMAGAVTVGTFLLWNRIRGPRPVRWLGRIGMLATSYAVAALAALVSINIMYGGLISGWGELWDNLKNTGTSSSSGHRFPQAGGPGGGGRPGKGGNRPNGTPPSGAP